MTNKDTIVRFSFKVENNLNGTFSLKKFLNINGKDTIFMDEWNMTDTDLNELSKVIEEEGFVMNNKELTEDEKTAIKKVANILANFVLDEIEHDKGSSNNNPWVRERAKAVASDLRSAFYWKDTKEGVYYWEDICHRLERIAEEGF